MQRVLLRRKSKNRGKNNVQARQRTTPRSVLLHVALLNEAWPVIQMLGLKQHETKPYKVFRGHHLENYLALLVSGVGKENTTTALEWILEKEPFAAALNIGTAGCSNTAVSLGEMFAISKVGASDNSPVMLKPESLGCLLPTMPLLSVEEPVCSWRQGPAQLADMEGTAFVAAVGRYLPIEKMGLVKIVSDHGSDKIPSKEETRQWMAKGVENWLPQVLLALEKTLKTAEEIAVEDTAVADTEDVLHNNGDINGGAAQGTQNTLWASIREGQRFLSLDKADREAIVAAASVYRFSFSQMKQMVDFAVDFATWGEPLLHQRFAALTKTASTGKEVFAQLRPHWEQTQNRPKSYEHFVGKASMAASRKKVVQRPKEVLGFGTCPVASQKTRCCNLLTLDAVEGCAFDCSYCAVKTFYQPDQVVLDSDFARKIDALALDVEKPYHIGTGQSSDSLLVGNRDGVLDALIRLAQRYPRVILEMKTKSNNVDYLLSQNLPPNILFTWSLNTPTIINAEEHGTASLEERLAAAQRMVQKGALVGFHFHPIVDYLGSRDEYARLYQRVQDTFCSKDVALVSFGTLTFTKPVMKQLRNKPMRSKVLQMPLVEAGGKFSYPLKIKQQMFRHAYEAFSGWHTSEKKDVFFYLCMEDSALWPGVFSHDYADNEAFEAAMISHYENRIAQLRRRQ